MKVYEDETIRDASAQEEVNINKIGGVQYLL